MIYVFGHRNPDTDSIMSAIALSNLKNYLGEDTIPCTLGPIGKEARYILDYFNIEDPLLVDNVKTQIKDLNYDRVESIGTEHTILHAYKLMESKGIRTLPIVNENNELLGIVTMKDIAMGLIKGDFYHIKTCLKNISKDLHGEILVEHDSEIEGRISVAAFYHDTLRESNILRDDSIVIVGDRYDIIEYAIRCRVSLIIITGGKEVPQKYLDEAKDKGVNVINVEVDTYTASKLINQCNYISSIINESQIIKFNAYEYVDDIREELAINRHSNYPIVTDDNVFLGFLSRRHILNPNRKRVILVDHNEYAQSVEGLKEADILEIIDHHKLGDISTSRPISFRNSPVGSTCTMIYNMYKEHGISVEEDIAGILLSGIISDTLLLKSPTTTDMDRRAIDELNQILKLDLDSFAMEMFKSGTSLEGQSIDEIFYKDFKEFPIEGRRLGVAQVFTLDIEDVFNRKELFIDFIKSVHEKHGYYLTLLLITDILKEGSYLLFRASNSRVISHAFEIEPWQGVFVNKVVSRKKQVIPRLMEAIKIQETK